MESRRQSAMSRMFGKIGNRKDSNKKMKKGLS